MRRQFFFQPSTVALSVALALLAPGVHAASFEGVIKGDGSVLQSSTPDASVSGGHNTSASQTSSYVGYVSSGTSRVAAISDGSVVTAAESTLIFRQSVTNPFASAQDVTFDFNIPRSRTIIDLGYGTNLQTFSAAASFTGVISWGGVTVWSVQYGVTGQGSVASGGGLIQASGPLRSASASGFGVGALNASVYVNTGSEATGCGYDENGNYDCTYTDVSGLAGSGELTSEPYVGALSLGTMAGNESKELVYTLTASASFEATYRDSSSSSAYGYGGYAQAGGYDPFGIEFQPNDDGTALKLAFAPAMAPVPEPGTCAMLLGGLGLLAQRVRSRKRAASAGLQAGADSAAGSTPSRVATSKAEDTALSSSGMPACA